MELDTRKNEGKADLKKQDILIEVNHSFFYRQNLIYSIHRKS
jgi:hypothetical protein